MDISSIGLLESLPSSTAGISKLKVCIDCEDELSISNFHVSTSSKDGRQPRCKDCDKKRRAAHNRGEHVKVSLRLDYDRIVSRKRAVEAALVSAVAATEKGTNPAPRMPPYKPHPGVSGGLLISGYIPGPRSEE